MNKKELLDEVKLDINKFSTILNNKNLVIVLIIYVIGTIIIMTRNFIEGIPFSVYSIVTYAILTFYFTMFIGGTLVSLSATEFIFENEYKGSKFIKFIKKAISSIIVIVIVASIMLWFMKSILYDTSNTFCIAYWLLLYCILPLFGFFYKSKKIKGFAALISMMLTFNIIFNIPASIGGLKPIQAKFYSYHDNIVYDYLYYGESNGNFIFKENENKIILRSCDSGYIEYYRDDIEEVKSVKYKIEIKETLSKVVEIEAVDEGEALRKIEEQYRNGEIVLDSGDYVDTEIEVYRD